MIVRKSMNCEKYLHTCVSQNSNDAYPIVFECIVMKFLLGILHPTMQRHVSIVRVAQHI